MDTGVEVVKEVSQDKDSYQELLKQLQESNRKIDRLETIIQQTKAVAEPRTTITKVETKEVGELDVYKEVSKAMIEERNSFKNSLLFNEAESAYTYKEHPSDLTNETHWEEIAVLNCYSSMPEDFKEKYGAKYKALEECRYHDILTEEVKRMQKFKTHYKLITGQELKEEQNEYYPRLRALYTRIFRKR